MPKKAQSEGKTIDLDQLFREGSGARAIAERLLQGKPVTRQDLSRDANLSVTSVNRVIASLERAGATIERTVGEDGRQAVFHLTSIGDPKVEHPYPKLGARARIVRGEILGEALMVDFTTDAVRYRGVLANLTAGPSIIGMHVDVVGVVLEPAGGASVELEAGEQRYHVGGVHAVA